MLDQTITHLVGGVFGDADAPCVDFTFPCWPGCGGPEPGQFVASLSDYVNLPPNLRPSAFLSGTTRISQVSEPSTVTMAAWGLVLAVLLGHLRRVRGSHPLRERH